jgi:hypothetical protein
MTSMYDVKGLNTRVILVVRLQAPMQKQVKKFILFYLYTC